MVRDSRQIGISETEGIGEEFHSALNAAVLIDRSLVGKLRVTGADGPDLLHRLSTNDLVRLKPFTATGTVFTTDKGRIVDFVRILSLNDSLLLVTSPSLEERLKIWIDKYTIMEDIRVTDITSGFAMYSIVGPKANVVGEELFQCSLVQDRISTVQFAGTDLIVGLESSFATDRVNILAPREQAAVVWDRLKLEMKAPAYRVMGEMTYESFRVFQGIPRESCELTDDFNPYEVGLWPWISSTKGCYIGQEVIARIDTYDKVQREPIRISFAEHLPYGSGKLSLGINGADVGFLTSFAGVPVNGEYFGIGVVRRNRIAVGSTLVVSAAHMKFKGVVTKVFSRTNR